MALSYEEAIEKLKASEEWYLFTDPQRVFLDGMAKGMKPTPAFMRAYPATKTKGIVFAVQQLMCRVGIQKALATIGIDTKKPLVTKTEARELLSSHLRKTDDPAVLVKLLGLYSKIAGWEEEETPSEEVSLDKLVEAIEKKRKG